MRSTVTPILLALLPATLMTPANAETRYYSLIRSIPGGDKMVVERVFH